MSTEMTPEQRAAEIGWSPQEAWRGDPEKWVDAETFLKRGEEIMPILRSNNRRLEEQNSQLRQQLTGLQDNMQEFVKTQQELLKERLEAQRKDLLAERKLAREAGDDEALDDVEARLDEVKAKKAKLEAAPPPPAVKPPPDPPELRAWRETNTWFGGTSREDQRKTALAMQLGREAQEEGLAGVAFLRYIDEHMQAQAAPRERADKTEGSRMNGGGSAEPEVKGYRSLPPEAKAACDADEKRFVGAGKMFKSQAEWRAHFVSLYN